MERLELSLIEEKLLSGSQTANEALKLTSRPSDLVHLGAFFVDKLYIILYFLRVRLVVNEASAL